MSDNSIFFLSSTVEDMKEERDAIAEVMTTLRQKISRCEYFCARSESPEQVCLTEAVQCDVFIGIYKTRYGFIPYPDSSDKISVCEMEYRKALENNKPILIFYSSESSGREVRLEEFLGKIKNFSKGHYVRKFRNTDELKYLVLQSLIFHLKNIPNITSTQRMALENLIPDLIKYNGVLLRQFEYTVASEISRQSTLIQYRLRDLYIPPKIRLYQGDKIIENNDEIELTRYGVHRFDLDGYSWNDIQDVAKEEIDKEQISLEIDLLDELEDPRTIIILGQPGSGKSTLMKFLCTDLVLNSNIVPFYIQIRDLAAHIQNSHKESILEYLKEKHQDLGLADDFFNKQFNAGSNLIVFDGLDEVWKPEHRKIINDMIQQFSASWVNYNKIIITSRESGYYQHPIQGNLKLLHVEPFDRKQIDNYIKKWTLIIEASKTEQPEPVLIKENATKLSSLIFNDTYLENLAKTPLILHIMCLVFLKNTSFPKRRHLLYSDLVESLLSTREEHKGISLELDWTDYVKILRRLAFWMVTKERIQIEQNDIIEIIKQHLIQEGLTSNEPVNIRKIIAYLEERSGIIKSDGIGNYNFIHLSFLEYFAAIELSEKMTVEEQYDFFKRNIHDLTNAEIIVFSASLITDKKGRMESSKFLNLILETRTMYEELHLVDMMLSIWCLANGALITDSFRDKIFSLIDKNWTVKRNRDFEFLIILSSLLATPYEEDLIRIWKKKCDENISFFRNRVSDEILVKSKYSSDLIKYSDIIFSKKTKADELTVEFYFLRLSQNNPSRQIITYMLNNIEKFNEDLMPTCILTIAKFISKNPEMREEYFKKLDSVEGPLRNNFLRCAILIDADRANYLLERLPDIEENESIRLELLGKDANKRRHERYMNDIKSCIANPSDERDVGMLIQEDVYTMHEVGYDNEFVSTIMSVIDTLSEEHSLLALRLSVSLEHVYNEFPESRDMIARWLDERIDTAQKSFPMLQFVRKQTEKISIDKTKKLIEYVLDKNKHYISKRFLLNQLRDNAENKELLEFLPNVLNDTELANNALYYLDMYPEELKKNISKIILLINNERNYSAAISSLRRCMTIYGT